MLGEGRSGTCDFSMGDIIFLIPVVGVLCHIVTNKDHPSLMNVYNL